MELQTGYVEVIDQGGSSPHTHRWKTALSTKRKANRQAANERRKEEAENLKKEGNDHFKEGHYIEAIPKYIKAARVYGLRPVVMSNLAAAYLKLEQYEPAEWAADCALFHSPAMAKARFRRAMARKGLGMFRRAELDLAVVIRHHPDITEAQTELINVQQQRKNFGDGPTDDQNYDEEFPPFDGEEWDPPLDSDSEDANHQGNGIACKFYNHGGCGKGVFCDYSHAPNNNSVRNELGQNVCLDFLLGNCKYGTKCIYAHANDNLPQGWWSTQEQIQEARKFRAALDAPDYHIIRMLENTTTYGRLKKVQSFRLSLELYSLYGLDISGRKIEEKAQEKADSLNEPAPQNPGRSVLIVCLSEPELFDNTNSHLLKVLRDTVTLIRANNATQVSTYLSAPELGGVIVGDAGIINRANSGVVSQLVDYVKRGGLVVFGGLFPSFISGDAFSRFFSQSFGLPWERGSYFRTTFHTNAGNDTVKNNPSLVKSYSMKALHVQGISPESAIYIANESSCTQSLVFPSVPITDFDESPAVSVHVGAGTVSYLGDVNAEEESTKTVLAMLRLLDTPLPPLPAPVTLEVEKSKESLQPTVGKTIGKKKKKRKGKKRNGGAAGSTQVTVPEAFSTPQHSAGMSMAAYDEPFILQLALNDDEAMDWSYKHSIAALKTKIAVKKATTEDEAWILTSSPSLRGVFATDCGLTDPKYKILLKELASYVDDGGDLVFGGSFSAFVKFHEVEPLFAEFQLGWKAGAYTNESIRLSGDWDYDEDKHSFLPKEIRIKALFLSGVLLGDEVYRPTYEATTSASRTPIALSRTDRGGSIGYIGDVNAEPCTTPCVLAMFNLLKPPHSIGEPVSRKFIIVLCHGATIGEYAGTPLFRQSKEKGIEIITDEGLSDARLVDLLSSSDLHGVLVLDDTISMPERGWLERKVAGYAWSGGTVIFGGDFGFMMAPDEFEQFLTDNFCLPWKISCATELTVKLNREHEFFRRSPHAARRVSVLHSEGTFLYDVSPDAIVYGSHPGLGPERATHVPVAYAAVGKGHVVYFGHDEIGEQDTTLMLAMLEL